jgi:hypothetical protein
MTPEQVQQIQTKWASAAKLPSSSLAGLMLADADADVERLSREIDRLRQCCDEITRQYARLAGEQLEVVGALEHYR